MKFRTKSNFARLEVGKVGNGLQFLDFTAIAYYLDFRGPVPNFYEAK